MPDIDPAGTKTLVHALLCSGEGRCSRPDCTDEVAAMKQALQSMEAHAASCSIGTNVPNRRHKQEACPTCAKWRQLQKLRDRFIRQLLHSQQRQKRKKPEANAQPVLMKRQVTMVMDTAEDDGLDLSLLPTLVDVELKVERRRRRAKEAKAAAAAEEAQDEPPPSRKRQKGGDNDTRAAEAEGVTSGSKGKKGAKPAETETTRRLNQMITDGARLAQAPRRGTAAAARLPPESPSPSGAVEEDGDEEDEYPPTEGMHVAFDKTRRKMPTTFDPIVTSMPPRQSNVGVVTKTHDDGSCDVTVVDREGSDCSKKCGAGAVVRGLRPAQRQIVCSGCFETNLAHAPPTLRCAGCDKVQPPGAKYRRAPPVGDSHQDVTLCLGCFGKLFGADEAARAPLLDDLEDEVAKLRAADFAAMTWQPEDHRDYDDFVQCTECDRWYHNVCGMYPAVDQLPGTWKVGTQLYVCRTCQPTAPATPKSLAQRAKLIELQTRRATSLPTCALSDAIQTEVAETLRAEGIAPASPIVVRVVSRKRMLFEAPRELKQRYGPTGYAPEFPYTSQAVLAFQRLGGRDVCIFVMYVQEYDADCPPPNTNRTYISYVDSVPYLQTAPPNARTPTYHAMLTAYLRYAAACGYGHAHIWVAPPTEGTEYFFHSRPGDTSGRPPMDTATLRRWYEKLLARAKAAGVVRSFGDLHEHTKKLTSVRDFPLFAGDFFPDKLEGVIEAAKQPPPPPPPPPPARGSKGKAAAQQDAQPKKLQRSETLKIADGIRAEASGSTSYAFLVATLNVPKGEPMAVPREKHIGPNELIDERGVFLEMSMSRHWQWDELRRAQWSTMMLLAMLGGPPDR